jgi:hypothetical protein
MKKENCLHLNNKVQYGLLFCLYLSRAGRGTIEDAAANLGLSKTFLTQVAHKLKVAGVLVSFRGPGGGYELKEEARMVEIFTALSPFVLLNSKELKRYVSGPPEHRALADFTTNVVASSYVVLRRKVKDVMNVLVANEVKHFGLININGLEN